MSYVPLPGCEASAVTSAGLERHWGALRWAFVTDGDVTSQAEPQEDLPPSSGQSLGLPMASSFFLQ